MSKIMDDLVKEYEKSGCDVILDTRTDSSGMNRFDRQATLLSIVKDAGEKGVMKKDIVPLWNSKELLQNDANALIDKGIIRKTGNTKGVTYFYIDRAEKLKDKSDTNFSKGKNSEGYYDPTASAAIREVDKMNLNLAPGSIVEHRTANGDTYDFLVLNSYGDNATGFRLCEAWTGASESPYSLKVGSLFKDYFIDISRLSTVPIRFLSASNEVLATPLKNVKDKLAEYLKLEGARVEVEKIVEKVVEKEVPVEVKSESDDVVVLRQMLEIYQAKIEVYREAFAAFGNNKGGN